MHILTILNRDNHLRVVGLRRNLIKILKVLKKIIALDTMLLQNLLLLQLLDIFLATLTNKIKIVSF